MIDYLAGTTCFFTLNSPQTVGFCVTSYLIMIQNESTHRKVHHFYVLKCDQNFEEDVFYQKPSKIVIGIKF